MNLINTKALVRGAMLVDYAFSESNQPLALDAPTTVGIVAAYINRGLYATDLERELGKRLTPRIGAKAANTFAFFNAWDGSGLWCQGPACDDFRFTNEKLDRWYPGVNAEHARGMASL